MKSGHFFLLLLMIAILAHAALAAVPQTVNYQGYLKDSAGVPVSAPTSIRFSLYSSNPVRSNPVWTETKSITPTIGIYSTQLGSVTPITAPFDVPYWLGVKVAGDAEMALQPLSSVPYALQAVTATTVATGGVGTASIADNSISSSKIAPGAVTDTQISGTISAAKLDLSGVQKKYARVAVVAQSGGDYTDPVAALADFSAWCPSRSANSRCLLKIMPGTYDIGSSPLTMLQYMDIEGSGTSSTVITGAVINSSTTPPANGVVNGTRDSELRQLTIINTASGGYVAAIVTNSYSPKISNVDAITTGAAEESYAVYNYYASPTLTGVTATSSGATSGYGVYNFYASPAMSEVTATGSGSANGFGVMNIHSSPDIKNSTARGLNSAFNYGINNTSSSTVALTNVTAEATGSPGTFNGAIITTFSTITMTGGSAVASGGTWNYGISNESSSAVFSNVNASGKGGTSNYGMANNDNGTPQTVVVDRCTLEGSSDSVSNTVNVSVKIGASKLLGPIASAGTITYLASYNDTTTLDSPVVGTQTFQTGANGNKGLIIKGAAGQSANLQEWQNNAGTAVASVSSAGVFTGNGSGLINVGTSSLTDGAVTDIKITGPISDSKLTSNIARLNATQTFSGSQTFNNSSTFNVAPTFSMVTGVPFNVSSTYTVTNLNADYLDGLHGSYFLNASNISSGTLPSGRLSGNYSGISDVGTLSSLAVSGNASIGGSLSFTTPKTIYYNVSAAAFTPDTSATTYSGTWVFRYLTAPAGIQNLAASLSLPHGAVLTSASCRVNDSSAAYNISIGLVNTVSNSWICGPATSGGSAGIQSLSTSSCSGGGGATIDNINSSYAMRVYNDTACGSACAIYACTVTYTVSGLP